jgi:hypothetical protein
MIEDPSQSEVRHAYPFRNQTPNFLDSFQSGIEIDAGERFTTIEFLAEAIEIPVIVRGKGRIATDFPGKQTAGERQANEDADIALLGERKKQVFRALPENIEDYLNCGNAGIFDGL